MNTQKYTVGIYDHVLNHYPIPESTTHLNFHDYFNDQIEPGIIPFGVQQIKFGEKFNQFLQRDVIPSSVSHVTFGRCYNQPLEPGVIPSSVTHLTFGYAFNQPFDKISIPDSVQYLNFGESFNQPYDQHTIPLSVTHLTLGRYTKTIAPNTLSSSIKIYASDNNYETCLNYGFVKISLCTRNENLVNHHFYDNDTVIYNSNTYDTSKKSFDGEYNIITFRLCLDNTKSARKV